jgi:AcrR family transcriptional regulator
VPRPSARAALLVEAGSIVLSEGPTALTYDHLAARAGVSKGGLLYHFPTKVDLVAALLDDVLDRFEGDVDARAHAAPTGGGAWARGYVLATVDTEVSRPELAVALLLTSPDAGLELWERCTARFDRWQERLEADGLSPATAAVVRFACDGWWAQRAVRAPGGGLGPGAGDDTVTLLLRDALLAVIDRELGGG